jgi:hypothetical protein
MTKAEADEKGDGYDCSSQPRDAGDTTIDCYTCEPKTCATYGLMTKAEADKKGDGYTCPSQSKNTGDTTADCYTCEPKTCKSYNMMTEEEAKKKGDSYVCSSQSKNTGDSTTACYTCEEKTCTETCTTGSTSITCGNGYVKTEQCTDCLGKPHYTCEPKTCATYGLMTEEEAKKKGAHLSRKTQVTAQQHVIPVRLILVRLMA